VWFIFLTPLIGYPSSKFLEIDELRFRGVIRALDLENQAVEAYTEGPRNCPIGRYGFQPARSQAPLKPSRA
jgi:hypothetical protein